MFCSIWSKIDYVKKYFAIKSKSLIIADKTLVVRKMEDNHLVVKNRSWSTVICVLLLSTCIIRAINCFGILFTPETNTVDKFYSKWRKYILFSFLYSHVHQLVIIIVIQTRSTSKIEFQIWKFQTIICSSSHDYCAILFYIEDLVTGHKFVSWSRLRNRVTQLL